jgi:DNA topoisomerase-2
MNKIVKLSPIEHVLTRPDMYIGSAGNIEKTDYVAINDSMEYKAVHYNNVIYKIFDEILVNARDQSVRDNSVSIIKVTISKDSFTVENDGGTLPIEWNDEYSAWTPELVFGHMLTGTNFDDTEDRVVGGRNGLGAKLANIWSKKFVVQLSDGDQVYRQTFTKNMTKIGKPSVSQKKSKQMTRITVFPDLDRIGISSIDEDTRAVMNRRVYDVSATSRPVVKLDGKIVKTKTVKHFAKMIGGENVLVHDTDRWRVAIFVKPESMTIAPRLGYVNGVSTPSGTHVAYIMSQITKHVRSVCRRTPPPSSVVSDCLGVIVDATITNPEFSNQQKDLLTTPQSKFGSSCKLPDDFLKRVTSKAFGLVERIESLMSSREDAEAIKRDSKKSRRLDIPKLDDATLAGTSRGRECTLILTEGDSAKTLAISGLSVVGRQKYGVFPLRGKLVNVRDNPSLGIKNAEIQHIKRILGLEHKKTYSDVSELRYGRVLIMTDADADGSHIKGLLLNFFDSEFPSLISIPGFVAEFVTPLVKVSRGRETLSFYSLSDYHSWESEEERVGWKVKYYKGLGTSTSAEAKEYFSDMDRHVIAFDDDEHRTDSLSLAFSKKRSDHRKTWIAEYDGTQRAYDVDSITVSDFIHRDLVQFSVADVVRSIPSAIDGLKPSQRKVLYACFKRNLKDDVKVAQLAGYVSEVAAYHHGEASLQGTIVGLAREYVGSNNINFLVPSGQFGTRICGGGDAASARYIFTRLSDVTRSIFPLEDDRVLDYLSDDGQKIEPKFYIPIVPTVLINGASGIGTGFSTSVPCYNPSDVIANVRRKIRGEPIITMTPWYRGFTGEIDPCDGGFVTRGRISKSGRRINVTELPVGTWTQPYKEYLTNREDIHRLVDDSTETTVDFSFETSNSSVTETDYRLESRLSTTNMMLFDPSGRVKKYTLDDIFEDHYHTRYSLYQKRKDHMLDEMRTKLGDMENRAKFVAAVVDGRLVITKREEDVIISEMHSLGIRPDASLLSMPIRSLTGAQVDKLEKMVTVLRRDIDTLRRTSIEDIWMTELDDLQVNM